MPKKAQEKIRENSWAGRLRRAQVYFSPDEYSIVIRAAKTAGVSISSWVAAAALRAASKPSSPVGLAREISVRSAVESR
jgi:hypothetical protein